MEEWVDLAHAKWKEEKATAYTTMLWRSGEDCFGHFNFLFLYITLLMN